MPTDEQRAADCEWAHRSAPRDAMVGGVHHPGALRHHRVQPCNQALSRASHSLSCLTGTYSPVVCARAGSPGP